MQCSHCEYFIDKVCDITHVINPRKCVYITNSDNVKDMNICYNCINWIGGGDWGLSCKINYYNTSSNGFDKACDNFERKI